MAKDLNLNIDILHSGCSIPIEDTLTVDRHGDLVDLLHYIPIEAVMDIPKSSVCCKALCTLCPSDSRISNIRDASKQGSLDWSRRYNIIEGIARGMLYLHRDSRLRINHRDLKASNVLLDQHFNAKISDFGMARIFCVGQSEATTKKVVGTLGYMSPEYAMEGHFSEKSDVFSFGVLLLEIVSGRRNSYSPDDGEYTTLLGYAWTSWSENRALELIDQSLGESFPQLEVIKCIQVGLLCVQEYPTDRPTMSSVVAMLSSDDATMPTPKQAAFFGRKDPLDLMLSSEICSANDLTITELNCR